MRLIPAIILSIAIILAPIIWIFVPRLMSGGMEEGFAGTAIDSGARIEIEMLSQQVEDLQIRLDDMTQEMAKLAAAAARAPIAPMPGQTLAPAPGDNGATVFQQNGQNDIIDACAQVVLIANRRDVNEGLTIAGPSYLTRVFGPPREVMSDDCEEMTNPRLADKLVLEDVGPIRVRMLKPAADSLRRVFEEVRVTDPDLYARINTAGSLCVRQIRGTRGRASTHAFGLAVDLNIDGVLDTLGDGKTQLGLTILADFFKDEGWVWGASWGREDSMHFEVSRQKLDEWINAGAL
ncbi:MAG: M15 family metallopeptidase [Marivita sp.]|uniref:M15 family metallopeptidase n=1 Tax=Marivita sp. TaxID=2003365 RepID=UPI001B046510|nr:M15 family metallopeptidase [Marivita sp.]MBO6883636.1 M15 family metallopeptidase [Marivita sp.]